MRKLLLLCLSGFVAAAAAHAQTETELFNKLEKDTADYSRALITELAQFQKFDSVPISESLPKTFERVMWLAPRFEKPDADFRFGYILSVYYWKLGDIRNAALTLARADLRSLADSLRCIDKSSPPNRLAPWRNAAQPVYKNMRDSSAKLKDEIRSSIEREELQISQRPASVWMCSGGSQQMVKLMEKYPDIAALDISKPIPQAILDKYPSVITVKPGNVVLSDNSILPDLLPEVEWKRMLPETISTFKKGYFSLLGLN